MKCYLQFHGTILTNIDGVTVNDDVFEVAWNRSVLHSPENMLSAVTTNVEI